jgi:hypothetical protein
MRRNPESTEAVNKDVNNPVVFGTPVVSPGVTDPAAVRYAAEVAARRGPPKYTTPVAGGQAPPIPRLDMPATDGSTMADQANVQRAGAQPPRTGLFQDPAPPITAAAPSAARSGPPPIGILPGDILPNEARSDPDFKEGQGSMYASSQPALALKYGVVRNGQRVAPQALGTARKGLGAKALADLQTINDLQKKRQGAESETAAIEQEAAAGVAGAAGRLGNSPTDGPQADPSVTSSTIKEAVKKLDDFDFNTFREMMMKDIINNEEQRDIIEARLKPLDVTDLVMRGFVTQRVPIVPGKFEPEFESMQGTEDLAIKRLIMEESKGIEITERYLLDKFSMMSVTIGLRAINGNVLPTHRDAEGNFDEAAFWKKFNHVTRFPFHMLASLGVNYFWFDIRVRKLFVAEKLGNG